MAYDVRGSPDPRSRWRMLLSEATNLDREGSPMAGDETIRPFEVDVPQEALDDLQRRAFFAPKSVPLSTGVSVLPDEICAAPRT